MFFFWWRLVERPLLVGQQIAARHKFGRSGRILVSEVVRESATRLLEQSACDSSKPSDSVTIFQSFVLVWTESRSLIAKLVNNAFSKPRFTWRSQVGRVKEALIEQTNLRTFLKTAPKYRFRHGTPKIVQKSAAKRLQFGIDRG